MFVCFFFVELGAVECGSMFVYSAAAITALDPKRAHASLPTSFALLAAT